MVIFQKAEIIAFKVQTMVNWSENDIRNLFYDYRLIFQDN